MIDTEYKFSRVPELFKVKMMNDFSDFEIIRFR